MVVNLLLFEGGTLDQASSLADFAQNGKGKIKNQYIKITLFHRPRSGTSPQKTSRLKTANSS